VELDQLCINTVARSDGRVQQPIRNPGTPMALRRSVLLWQRHLRYILQIPNGWTAIGSFCRRACCMLLYSVLYLTGYDLRSTTSNSSGNGAAVPGTPNTASHPA